MKHFLFIAILFAAACISCDDDTDGLGASIADYEDNAEYSTAEYDVVTRTVRGYNIHVSPMYSYVGKIYDPETETTLTANYMTQLVPRNDTTVFSEEKLIEHYPMTGDVCNYADSCYLIVSITENYGDSLAHMKVKVNELKKPYEEDVNDTIGYDPTTDTDIIDPTDPSYYKASVSYTPHNIYSELQSGSTTSSIMIPMNHSFTREVRDSMNVLHRITFNNYGSYMMYMYYHHHTTKNKDYFSSPVVFNNNVCAGFFIQNELGQGVLSKVSATALEFCYRLNNSTTRRYKWLAGTKEVIQQSNIKENEPGSVNKFIANCNADENPYSYVASPLGIYTEMTLDVDGIMDKHEEDSVSTVRIFIPCVNPSSTKGYVQDPPTTLLMVGAEDEDEYSFFDKKQVTDDKKTFLSSYSSTTNGYTFDNISTLITALFYERKKFIEENNITKEQYAQLFPEWNRVLLIPVETAYNTSSILLSVNHSMLLQGSKLKRKKTSDEESPIKASVIYSRFKDKEQY